MTNEEIVKALRQCAKSDCSSCGLCPIFSDRECVEHLVTAAANLIEQLIDENVALREYAKLFAGCDTCKRRNYCKSDSECNACEQDVKGNCYCKDCERWSKWEWQGLEAKRKDAG